MLRLLVKRGIDHFHIVTTDRLFDIRHFLRTLVDQQNDQLHLWVILKN